MVMGNGDPEDGMLAEWTDYQSRPGNPEFLSGPGEILDTDLNFIQSCLNMVRNRTCAIIKSLLPI